MKTIITNDIKDLYYYIALDFDGTLVEHCFPEIGFIRLDTIEKLKKRIEYIKSKGLIVILLLWTCRVNLPGRNYLDEAVEWCKENGIEIEENGINNNPYVNFGHPELVKKIYADEYWDDKAVGC
jgi:hypothetical protein